MKVLLAAAADADRWREAFAARLPGATIAVWPDAPPDADYALVWRAPADLFARVRVRRAIFNLGAGVDALLAVPGLPAGVPVLRLEDAGMAEQMAEYAALAVLRAFRDAEHYAREQRAGRWTPLPRRDKRDFRVGLLGAGVLGRAVARTLTVLGFPLAAWSRTPHAIAGAAVYAGIESLRPFLASVRVAVALLPSTPATRGLLDAERLSWLPEGAHLVNAGRGDLVVDADLVAALDSGRIASATLDVYRAEPLPPEHPFWHHPGIVMTPHVSALTRIAESADQVAAKIAAIERGEPVSGVVDRARGY